MKIVFMGMQLRRPKVIYSGKYMRKYGIYVSDKSSKSRKATDPCLNEAL